ncbi:hypothetical protein [Nostoc sp.]|uniref:hypothetical protein n=1 Tax=Nostoc sp. TaxID=1180 RepID=UPI002FF4DECE
MTQTNCPRCDCTTLQYQENYGYWECLDCGHVWAVDVDDPDYDELLICPKCSASSISLDPIFGYYKCSSCFTAWVNDEDDPEFLFRCSHCGYRFLEWNFVSYFLYCPACKHYSYERIK